MDLGHDVENVTDILYSKMISSPTAIAKTLLCTTSMKNLWVTLKIKIKISEKSRLTTIQINLS